MLAKTGTEQAKQISETKLRKLVKQKDSARKQTSEINGAIGGTIADAVEKDNLDKVAFAMACRLDRMSPEKLNTTLPALLFYIDALKLEDKAASAPSFDSVAGAEEEDGEKE